jgi:CRISPR system Cascade subunit CasE
MSGAESSLLHLSRLILNPRSRVALRDLESPYSLHQTLLRAFDREGDEQGAGRKRAGHLRFRVEPAQNCVVGWVLVQAENEAKWERVAQAEPGYFAQPPEQKKFTLPLREGQRLHFRLRANPTHARTPSKREDGRLGRGKRAGIIGEEPQRAWLAKRLERGGATLLDARIQDEGLMKFKGQGGRLFQVQSMFAEGVLEVTDPIALATAVREGLGSAKGLGFGLLSLARAV